MTYPDRPLWDKREGRSLEAAAPARGEAMSRINNTQKRTPCPDLSPLSALAASVVAKTRRPAHAHFCANGCGDYYICSQPHASCPVPKDWCCVACSLAASDARL